MKILINLALFNPKKSADLAKTFMLRIATIQNVDVLVHSLEKLQFNESFVKEFTYDVAFSYIEVLKKTLLTLNDREINDFNQYDIIFNVSDSNLQSFIRIFDTPIQSFKHIMNGLLRSPKKIVVPLRFSEPFDSVLALSDKIFISNVQIFRILSSMAIRTHAHPGTVFGFVAHRLGIPVVGVED